MAQDRRVTRTKAALTRALFELLGEKEFSKITITELARRADVDRKTFYLHYQSSDEILEEFYTAQIQRLRELLAQEDGFGTQVDIPGFFRVLNGLMNENIDLYRQLAKGPALAAFQDQVRDLIQGVIQEYLTRRTQMEPYEVELYALFYASAASSVYHAWLRGELKVEEDEMAQRMGQAVSDGLRRAIGGRDWGVDMSPLTGV